MTTQVRTIDSSELTDWIVCKDLGFLKSREHPEEVTDYYRTEVDLERTWGAFDGDRVVGTLRTFPTSLCVPGAARIGVSALTNVTVSPTHTRLGLLTQMITGELTASLQRSEALSILIASEFPIYGRFGYGPAVDSATYTIEADAARFPGPGEGTIELVDFETFRKEAPGVYEAYHALQPGSIGRNDHWWDRRLGMVRVPGDEPAKGYCALYRDGSGVADGYLRYSAEPHWDAMTPRGSLQVHDLVALTPAAYRALWKFCCEVDLVTTVRASDRCVEEPLIWMLGDARVLRQTMRFDFIWVRLLDVAAALGARSYLVEGRLVIEITDPLDLSSGRYLLDGGPDGALCSRTTEPADLALAVDALGSIYLGGPSLRSIAAGRKVDELTEGALDTADKMFRSTTVPWCSTWF